DIDPVVLDLTKVPDGDVSIDEGAIRLPVGVHVVSIRPSKITVQFEYQKKVPVAPDLAGTPAEGYIVRNIVVDPPKVMVRGSKTYVDGLVDVRTLPVSVAGKRAPVREHIALAPLPKGVEADADAVSVEVQVEEEVAQKPLSDLPIQLQQPPGV